ncbi:Leucine rich repeat containing 15 [Chamberlinius hualienensis]
MANKVTSGYTSIKWIGQSIISLLLLTFVQSSFIINDCNINCQVENKTSKYNLEIKVWCTSPTSYADDRYNLDNIVADACFPNYLVNVSHIHYTKISLSNVNELKTDYFCSNDYNVSHLILSGNKVNTFAKIGFDGNHDLCHTLEDDQICDNRLWTLNLNENPLQELKNNSFCHLKNLMNLHLSNCELNTIESDAFQPLSRLITLYLDGNQLTQIPYLQHLTSLRWLYISRNSITTITSDDFTNCTFLSSVILSYNNISFIDENAFDDLNILYKLDLSHNRLTTLSKAFEKLNAHFLYLDFNLIKVFDFNFQFSFKLSRLDLSGNGIKNVLYAEPYPTSTHIRRVDLSRNKIKTFVNFPIPHTLESLDLSHNQIEDFSLKTISLTGSASEHNTIRFKILNLSHNNLTAIANETFNQLVYLQKLFLSHNYLSQLPIKSIATRKSLEVLHLHDNRLTSFPKLNLFKLSNFQELTIQNNDWSCNCTFLTSFKQYLEVNVKIVKNPSEIFCTYVNGSEATLDVKNYYTNYCSI